MVKEVKELKTAAEIKIYSDPYRLKILSTFMKLGRPATSKEVADAMGEVPAKVYYHVKKLESIGLIHIVETREINGIVAKYYKPFSGEVRLKQSEIEPALKKVYLSETQKLIQEMYDQNKQKFLSHIDGNTTTSGRLYVQPLFMTNEEADQLARDIEALVEPYAEKRKGKDIYEHELFWSLINENGLSKKSSDDEEPPASS